jgi:bile-acid 7alpha-dehydratase
MDPMQALVEIEAIKKLKARYQRAVDTKDWELMRSVLAPNARSVYSDGKYSFEGRDAIVGFLSDPKGLGNTEIQSMHHAHTPEIEITSETTASGKWYLEDFVLMAIPSDWAPNGSVMHGTGIYIDEYVKIDGEWYIQETGYERIFEDFQPRGAGSRLRTRWDDSPAGTRVD